MGIGFMMLAGNRHTGDRHEDMEARRRRGEMDYPSPHMYHDDWHEMDRRRRSRGMYEDDTFYPGMEDHYDEESRRGRARSYDEGSHYDEESRRGRPRSHYDEPQRMGYVRDERDDMRAMMHDISKKLDKVARSGYASVKKLAPNLEGVLEDATEVMQEHPKTWLPYIQKHDYAGIAKMEGKELLSAIEAKKPAHEIRKELVHTIAALLQFASE